MTKLLESKEFKNDTTVHGREYKDTNKWLAEKSNGIVKLIPKLLFHI